MQLSAGEDGEINIKISGDDCIVIEVTSSTGSHRTVIYLDIETEAPEFIKLFQTKLRKVKRDQKQS